jgi:pimeloyl-ACP methyl ester carboxylesterase
MKTTIKNRNNQKVVVLVEGQADKLAFVMHGLGGNKDEPHIRAIAEAFLESDYTVVTFDTTNTFGESDGAYEDATLTGYYNDLEDVIAWASGQPWYAEPFALAGHSFGGIAISLFTETYPQKVARLAPISSVVSGDLTLQTPIGNPRSQYLEQWKREGVSVVFEYGIEKRLKWACMEDRLKYSVLPKVGQLTMPVLLIVGGADDTTPPQHQQIFYDALPGKKELHIIKGAIHIFDKAHERQELKQHVITWLQKD